MENLECLPSLQFLTLAGNRTKTIENIRHLTSLLFLDLSDNAIDHFDIDEFPTSLIILNLKGNPCCNKPDYRGRIVQELEALKQLDGEEVSSLEKREVGYCISSGEEEGEEDGILDEPEAEVNTKGRVGIPLPVATEPKASFTGYRSKLPDIEVRLQDLSNEMLMRSQNRAEEALALHRRREMEMDNIRIQDHKNKQQRKKQTT